MASLRNKVESALTTALAGVTTNIYAGMGSANKALPCIIARAVSCEDVVPLGGRYLVTCEITVEATAGSAVFDDLCETVKGIVDAAGFTASLVSVDLYVYGTAESSHIEWGNNGDSWTETRTIQIECAPKA